MLFAWTSEIDTELMCNPRVKNNTGTGGKTIAFHKVSQREKVYPLPRSRVVFLIKRLVFLGMRPHRTQLDVWLSPVTAPNARRSLDKYLFCYTMTEWFKWHSPGMGSCWQEYKQLSNWGERHGLHLARLPIIPNDLSQSRKWFWPQIIPVPAPSCEKDKSPKDW